jgi:hypothetical protein
MGTFGVRRAILERFPPGPERTAWLQWAAALAKSQPREFKEEGGYGVEPTSTVTVLSLESPSGGSLKTPSISAVT